jgi:hypothetical protein
MFLDAPAALTGLRQLQEYCGRCLFKLYRLPAIVALAYNSAYRQLVFGSAHRSRAQCGILIVSARVDG